MTYRRFLPVLALAAATAISHAQAQSENNGQDDELLPRDNVPPLSEWNYDEVYEKGHFLGGNLLRADAIGEEDDEIGNIANAVLDEQNQIVALIAEVGGFWGIGSTHVAVPWDEAELTEEGVRIPVNEDNVDDYDLYGEDSVITEEDLQQTAAIEEEAETGERTWKLTELINDYANLEEGTGFGYVNDTVFSEEGELLSVIIMPSGMMSQNMADRGGAAAYPFLGFAQGWHPGLSSYQLPYSEEEISQMTAFNHEEFEGLWMDD